MGTLNQFLSFYGFSLPLYSCRCWFLSILFLMPLLNGWWVTAIHSPSLLFSHNPFKLYPWTNRRYSEFLNPSACSDSNSLYRYKSEASVTSLLNLVISFLLQFLAFPMQYQFSFYNAFPVIFFIFIIFRFLFPFLVSSFPFSNYYSLSILTPFLRALTYLLRLCSFS